MTIQKTCILSKDLYNQENIEIQSQVTMLHCCAKILEQTTNFAGK